MSMMNDHQMSRLMNAVVERRRAVVARQGKGASSEDRVGEQLADDVREILATQRVVLAAVSALTAGHSSEDAG
jgi:hypothetical protein